MGRFNRKNQFRLFELTQAPGTSDAAMLEADAVTQTVHALQAREMDWLLVLDNAEREEDEQNWGHGTVTSRFSEWGQVGAVHGDDAAARGVSSVLDTAYLDAG